MDDADGKDSASWSQSGTNWNWDNSKWTQNAEWGGGCYNYDRDRPLSMSIKVPSFDGDKTKFYAYRWMV